MKYHRDNKGVSLVLVALSLVTLLGFAAIALDLGNMLNVKNELDKAANSAVLMGASTYNQLLPVSKNKANMLGATQQTFNLAVTDTPIILTPTIQSVNADTINGAVRMVARCNAQTYFISVLGITKLQVESSAAAINFPCAYRVASAPATIPGSSQKPTIAFAEGLITPAVAVHSYNLEAGGSIVLTCLLPAINSGVGADISVVESGDLDGYYIFVASNLSGPWYNISGTGTPIVPGGPGPQPGNIAAIPTTLGQRFFGSGTFSLASTGIQNAKYVAIVDDGFEEGYNIAAIGTFVPEPTFIETPAAAPPNIGLGADIDAVIVHNHSILIRHDDLGKDLNGNGFIDAHDNLLGNYTQRGKFATNY